MIKAMQFAIMAHEKVNHRYDGAPYSVHLALAADYARQFINLIPEESQDAVMSAVWLHDTIEDARITYNDIVKEFSVKVADMVYAVTNEKGKTRNERANEKYYEGIRNTPFAWFVKMCDRLANVHYSKEFGNKQFEMYLREHCVFVKKIHSGTYSPKVIHYPMILKLNQLFNG